VLASALLALLTAGPAAAVELTPTPQPLPGSSFQGADGDQADAAPLFDWATLQSTGGVTHTPDQNAQDTAFSAGKENEPGGWSLAVEAGGVKPSQANILDAWSSVDEQGANTFLYLAFARAAGTGTSFLTFELNRDRRLWDNGNARIPCRLEGDVLITFEPHGDDDNVTVLVQTWHTGTNPTDTDPASGCARRGTLGDAASFTANVDAQGAANAAAIPNSLGGTAGATIGARQFGEAALNLGTILDRLGKQCGAFTSVWMHSRSSDSPSAGMQDFVAPHTIDARRCSAAGTKWIDLNADGTRQAGDIGLEGFRVYADLNNDNRYDNGEPFAITDKHGDYVIDDIRATGSYTLREAPTASVPLAGPWTCSYPAPDPACNWTVDATAEPYARDRDFGNWRPARVTLTKALDPENDRGRFDLSVGPFTVPGAGNGDGDTFELKPGSYVVSETAAAGTNPADYLSSVACTSPEPRAGRLRSASTALTVIAGERVVCKFVNSRIGSPSVAIDKIPPPATLRGETLVYEMHVTNTGNVAFPAGDVRVSDSQCDDLQLVGKADVSGAADATPGTLNPGDRWTYRCEVPTTLPDDPDDCEPDPDVSNTATVTVPGDDDSSEGHTSLQCPPKRRVEVQITKLGPPTAVAGTQLTYVFVVVNTGEVPFAEQDVVVSDPDCDAPPALVARYEGGSNQPDATPERLDPGDAWAYQCTRTTDPPGADCAPFPLENTATVVATRGERGDDDSDSFTTSVTCPPPPEPPGPPAPPPPPAPAPSGEIPDVPAGPVTPDAGTAGRAALSPLRRCLRRGSQVVVRGARIASIRVLVRGRPVGGLQVRALQRRAVIRLARNFQPGRYRATAVVRFQRGAGTPRVRLSRAVRVCARRQVLPRFTG
jgi:hypothetical protein